MRCRICLEGKISEMGADDTMTKLMLTQPPRHGAIVSNPSFTMKPMIAVMLGGISLLMATPGAMAQKQRIQISNLEKIVRIADPQISPDDQSIAIVVARANVKDDRYDSQIVLVDIASGA